MLRLLPVITAMVISMLAASHAQSADLTTVECPQCRDVYRYPSDFGNHAYNQVFGSNPTLGFAEGDVMRVVAPNGQWAVVDLNFVFQEIGLSVNLVVFTYAISVPNGKIQMIVQDPRGKISEFEAFALSPDLLVGDGSVTAPPPEPEPEEEAVQETEKVSSHAAGEEIVCCQSGTFYWYYDQPAFSIQFGNE